MFVFFLFRKRGGFLKGVVFLTRFDLFVVNAFKKIRVYFKSNSEKVVKWPAMQQKRHLIIIPIIHTLADWGSLGSRKVFDEEIEARKTQYWQDVSEYVRNLPLDFSELRVYQDGLRDTSAEEVARSVDKIQTINYELLRWLRNKGAHTMGTESLPLLLQGFRALQIFLNAPEEEQKQAALLEYRKVSARITKKRDGYIAQRIRDTLPEDGRGILFIGLAHEVKRLLEQEMEVSEPETLIGLPSEALRRRLFHAKE